jgi:hypothetical protein
MRDFTESQGGRFVMLLFPMFDSVLGVDRYRHLQSHLAIARFAEENAIPLLDIRDHLAKINPDGRSWWAQPFDSHPNAAAHKVAGKAVAIWLKMMGLLHTPRAVDAEPSPKSTANGLADGILQLEAGSVFTHVTACQLVA